jgi:DNA helicase II / ATP-dependent DNA helicase PcrA
MIKLPSEAQFLEISDEDIQAARQYFPECSFDDVGCQEALKRMASCDVQACPGSGKTTLLVAKLAILASKCDWRGQGVCVLSHTNVARLEVESRLAQHPKAQCLLHYPHFIGTIQSFVDRYLALPYLRNQGIDVHAVDSDRFSKRARSIVQGYPQARVWLRNHPGKDYLGQLRYEGADLRLSTGVGDLGVGAGTPTYRQLSDLKKRISEQDGIFRFDDMYAFAEAYLSESPYIIEALRTRFPWVFLDEMQDTSGMQERILGRIFGDPSIVQRFGDINQAIFSGEEDSDAEGTFPGHDVIELHNSWRFGPEIASLTSNLTVKKPQTLVGLHESSEHHTLFVFRNETIHQVLPAFAELILDQHNGHLPEKFLAKAVGLRKSGDNADPRKVPFKIGDYWGEFRSDIVKSSSPNSLLRYVMKARHLVREREEVGEGYAVILSGVLHLLHTEGDRDANGRRFSNGRLLDTLEAVGEKRSLQRLVANLCVRVEPLDEPYWVSACDDLVRLRSLWDPRPLSDEGLSFLRWEAGANQVPNGELGASEGLVNVFHHNDVAIEVGTIHGVKGETHGATLVLETFMVTHDLRALLPYLSGERDVRNAIDDRAMVRRMQPVFVGMTRPRGLICLAMHRDHLSAEYETILRSLGWRVQEIAQPVQT